MYGGWAGYNPKKRNWGHNLVDMLMEAAMIEHPPQKHQYDLDIQAPHVCLVVSIWIFHPGMMIVTDTYCMGWVETSEGPLRP